MRTSQLFEVALAIILTSLAGCLACGIAGRLLLGSGVDATPTLVAVQPTATHTPAEKVTLPLMPSPTPTPVMAWPSPTFTSSPALSSPTPTPLVVTDPSLTNRELLEQQFRETQTGQRLTLRIHDDHLEREIAAYLATQPDAPYRKVTVRFTPGLVELGGQVKVLDFWVPATVRAQATVRECQPQATITGLTVGGLLTPRWARDYVASLIYDALDRYPDDLAICLESIDVQEGEATVEGNRR